MDITDTPREDFEDKSDLELTVYKAQLLGQIKIMRSMGLHPRPFLSWGTPISDLEDEVDRLKNIIDQQILRDKISYLSSLFVVGFLICEEKYLSSSQNP